MGDRSLTVVNPVWMKQAEEAKLKREAKKSVTTKASFDTTFNDIKIGGSSTLAADSDSEEDDLKNNMIGPVDSSKCTATGTGIAGGTACSLSSFVVVTKDSDGKKVGIRGAIITVKVSHGVGLGGLEHEVIMKDMGYGSYTVTYVVPTRGNYMVTVQFNGSFIMGKPLFQYFSAQARKMEGYSVWLRHHHCRIWLTRPRSICQIIMVMYQGGAWNDSWHCCWCFKWGCFAWN